ncbi:MFS transporter [Streptacidiphilus sp. N1-10]|uniref:MFS transporter n=1 Tax=Streptacidiphilus jeojiensis TaxID=3229225 RepID=A0ABV6XPA5_9ACTN
MISRSFTLIWVSQALSDMASEMTSLALPLAVLAATRSPVDAAMVATAVGIAQLIAKLPSGLVADTVNRKTLLLLCDAGRAVIALLLALALATGQLTTIVAVAAAAATAVVSTLFSAGETGVIRQAVPVAQRRQAITRTIVRTNIAIAVGPPLGGLLLTLGAPIAFLVDSASYLLSLLLLSRVVYQHLPRPAESVAGGGGAGALRHTTGELTRGFEWVFKQRPLLFLVAFVAYLNLLGRSVELLAAIGASDLGRHPVSAGWVLTAAGCGGIAGGVCTGWILRRFRPVTVLGGIGAVWLVLTPLTGLGHTLLTVAAVGVIVFFLPPIGSLVSLQVGLDAPAHLLGRISAAVALLAGSIAWAGPGITGFLIAGQGGLTAAIVLVAPLLLPLGALCASPRLRTAVNSVRSGDDPAEVPELAASSQN